MHEVLGDGPEALHPNEADNQSAEEVGQSPVDEVPEGLVIYPGEVFPRSPPASLDERLGQQLEPKGSSISTISPSAPEEEVVEALDPEVEEMIRAYAMGDLEEEAQLREKAKKDGVLRESLRNPGGGLIYCTPVIPKFPVNLDNAPQSSTSSQT